MNNYKLIRKRPKTQIYEHKKGHKYLKLFTLSEDHSTFLHELLTQESFVKRFCRALLKLIYDRNGILRGYTMRAGKILTVPELTRYLTNEQKMWKDGIARWQFYYNDIKANNFIRIDNHISLIDLDAISRLKRVKLTENVRMKIKTYKVGWYYSYINSLKSVI